MKSKALFLTIFGSGLLLLAGCSNYAPTGYATSALNTDNNLARASYIHDDYDEQRSERGGKRH